MKSLSGIVAEVAAEHNLPKEALAKITKSLFQKIVLAAKEDGRVMLNDFGTFTMKETKARTMKVPGSETPVEVPARRKLAYKPAKAVCDSLAP